MSSKLAPPPPIDRDTMLALLGAATEFATTMPWEDMFDCHVVGLTDPATSEIRLATVLGNAGEVFGAAFYQRAAGLRWLLNMLTNPEESLNMEDMLGMDSLKIEFVPKNEMLKPDLNVLKELNFKPTRKGMGWPQFQSVRPGWSPWFINQSEAEQLLADLPRLTQFCALFRKHPDMYESHLLGEIPFLPQPFPSSELRTEDLDWRSLMVASEVFDPFKATDQQSRQLQTLKRDAKAAYEYGIGLSGGRVLEQGRPCYSRLGLLLEHNRGLVLGFELSLAIVPFAECAGSTLVKTLVKSGGLPETILIDDDRLETILGPLCNALNIELRLTDELPNLAEARASVDGFMRMSPG